MKILKNIPINYLIIALISITIGFVLEYGNISVDSLIHHTLDTTAYITLFSTIATILSSIFALIFVVLTISIQLSNKYTSFNLILNKETTALTGIYFLTIISCLLMMQSGYYFPVFVVTLTVFCILSLYPFLQNINFRIMYDIGVQNLGEEISELIDCRKQASAIHRAEELGYLGEKALRKNDLKTVTHIMAILSENIVVAGDYKLYRIVEVIGTQYIKILAQYSPKTNDEILEEVLSKIPTYMSLYSSNINRHSLNEQQKQIRNLGISFINRKLKDEYILLIANSLFLSLEENYDSIWDFNNNGIMYLSELAKLSFNHGLKKPFEEFVFCLWLIGFIIHRKTMDVKTKHDNNRFFTREDEKKVEHKLYSLRKSLSIAVTSLKMIEEICGNDCFEDIYDRRENSQILTWIENLNFSDFKEYYSQSI